MDKKYLVNVFTYLISGILAIALIVFVVYHLAGLDGNDYTTATAERVKAELGFEGDAYFFKDEVPLRFKGSGMAYSALPDGENVRVGTELCGVYLPSPEVREWLRRVDRLEAVFKEAEQTQSLSRASAEVRALMSELRGMSDSGCATGAAKLCDALLSALDRRSTAAGVRIDFAHEKELIAIERKSLIGQLGSCLQTVTAPVSGNYVHACDGYEEAFSFENAENLAPESFEKLLASAKQTDLSADAGKIVRSAGWRLVLLTDTENTVPLAAGNRYSVRASTGEELDLTLEKAVSDPKKGTTLLTFFSRSLPETPIGRCDRVKVIAEKVDGLTIPGGALRYAEDENGEGKTFVYVQRGNKVTRKDIEIITSEGGSCIVKDYTGDREHPGYLELNDAVITSGRDVREGYTG